MFSNISRDGDLPSYRTLVIPSISLVILLETWSKKSRFSISKWALVAVMKSVVTTARRDIICPDTLCSIVSNVCSMEKRKDRPLISHYADGLDGEKSCESLAHALVEVVGDQLGHEDGICFAGECELGWCDLWLSDEMEFERTRAFTSPRIRTAYNVAHQRSYPRSYFGKSQGRYTPILGQGTDGYQKLIPYKVE